MHDMNSNAVGLERRHTSTVKIVWLSFLLISTAMQLMAQAGSTHVIDSTRTLTDRDLSSLTLFALRSWVPKAAREGIRRYALYPDTLRTVSADQIIDSLMRRRKPTSCAATLTGRTLVIRCDRLNRTIVDTDGETEVEPGFFADSEAMRRTYADGVVDPIFLVTSVGDDEYRDLWGLISLADIRRWERMYDVAGSMSVARADARAREHGASAVIMFGEPIGS